MIYRRHMFAGLQRREQVLHGQKGALFWTANWRFSIIQQFFWWNEQSDSQKLADGWAPYEPPACGGFFSTLREFEFWDVADVFLEYTQCGFALWRAVFDQDSTYYIKVTSCQCRSYLAREVPGCISCRCRSCLAGEVPSASSSAILMETTPAGKLIHATTWCYHVALVAPEFSCL